MDPLRQAWAGIDRKAENSIAALKEMRAAGGTWLSIHHRRKQNREQGCADLIETPMDWLQESAGTLGIINHTDTRLGVEQANREQADIVLSGVVRGHGKLPPIYVRRVMDETGQPMGYVAVQGPELLNQKDREVYQHLGEAFRFKEVESAFSGSGSNATRFVQTCEQLGIAALKTPGKSRDGYVKCSGVSGVIGANS